MDLQTLFYVFGIVYFVSSILIIIAILAFGLLLYGKYRRAKRKVERFKEAIPFLSFVAEKLRDRKRKRN